MQKYKYREIPAASASRIAVLIRTSSPHFVAQNRIRIWLGILNYLACEPWLNESAAERLRKAAGSCKLKLSPLSPPHIFAPLPAGKPLGKTVPH